MRVYVVAYAKTSRENTVGMAQELQNSPGWAHYMDTTWWIATQEGAQTLYARLARFLGPSGQLMIIEISKELISRDGISGWLPAEAWKWLADHQGWVASAPVAPVEDGGGSHVE